MFMFNLSAARVLAVSVCVPLAVSALVACSDGDPAPAASTTPFVRPTMPGAAPTTAEADRTDKDVALYLVGAAGTACAGKLIEHALPASKQESSAAAALRLLTTTKAPTSEVVNPWFGAKADPTVTVAGSVASTSLSGVVSESFSDSSVQGHAEQILGHTLKKALADDGKSAETVKADLAFSGDVPAGMTLPWNVRPLPLPGVRAPIWITYPSEGARVPAHGFRVTGSGTAPDGKLTFDVFQHGKSVKSGTPKTGADGTFAPLLIKPVLQPGEYELVVRQATPSPDFGSCTEVKRKFTLY